MKHAFGRCAPKKTPHTSEESEEMAVVVVVASVRYTLGDPYLPKKIKKALFSIC